MPGANALKKRILVGDDDPGMRLALLIRLRANNYEVSCAGDGLSVVAEARKYHPDLILLDLGMPSGDGYTVLKMLRSEPGEAQIPVIVLSARDRASHEERSKEAGATTFLQKPVETDHLLFAITQALCLSEFSHV
jgi:two-component system KDP operon response regulator KdpE